MVPWPALEKRAAAAEIKKIAVHRRSTSLSDLRPTQHIHIDMEIEKPVTNANVPTKNRFGILADCPIGNENDSANLSKPKFTETPVNPDTTSTKPPPVYIHSNINHYKFLEALKDKYYNNFHAKYTSDKLKIIFQNLLDFKEFKEMYCNDNIQFHTYAIRTEKVLTVVLKGLIKLPEKIIINNLKTLSYLRG